LIIRKPYAFFIKNFKLFHFLFLFLSFLILSDSISMFEFLHDYTLKIPTLISTFEISSVLVNYFWIILLLLGLMVVMGVLIYKKKSIKFYIIQILVYISTFILLAMCNNYLNDLTRFLVDIRIIKALHDILFVFCIVEAISMVLLFTRATGFDIKSFDFDKEYTALVADESDREEVEVSLDLDINTVKTRINKTIRDLKYFYLENKLVSLILAGIGIICLIVMFSLYLKSRPYITVRGNTISYSSYVLNFKNFYVDDSNMGNNVVEKNSLFVVVDMNIKSTYKTGFNTSNLMLRVGGNIYTPSSSYNQYFTDFGTGYNSQEIKGEERFYFVYKIPSDINLKNAEIVYNSGLNYYIKRIKLVDLRNDDFKGTYSVGDVVNLENYFDKQLDLKIDEVAFNDKFLVPYVFKTGKVNYNSSFYVSPSISGNYDKSIIRVESSNCDLISNYGNIYYEKDEKLIKSNVLLKEITTKKNYGYCYFETDKDVLQSDTVLLKINVRGNIYNYYLK